MNKDMPIFVARILYPVKVLGPGNRIGIWLSGCEHQCKGCSNPELWHQNNKYLTTVCSLLLIIKSIAEKNQIDGFTVTGGDPFFQARALEQLLHGLKDINPDILVYTGYEYEGLKGQYGEEFLKDIAVLIDGKYVEEKNDGSVLRGSSNQRIIFLNTEIREKYKELLENGTNEIQNFSTGRAVVSVGIHRRGYEMELENLIKKKGVILDE